MFELFPWTPQFETGIAKVDGQHRILVGLINGLARQRILGNTEPGLDTVVTELANYASYHFRTEETLWHEALADDDWVETHAATHQAFLAEVTRMRQAAATPVTVDQLLTFLVTWLVDHILGDDKRLALAVLGVREGLSPQAARLRAQNQMSNASAVLLDALRKMYQAASLQTMELLHEQQRRQQTQKELDASESRWHDLVQDARPGGSALEQTLRTVINHLPAGLAAADATSHRIVFANPWFCRMLGYTLDEVLSMSPEDFHPPEVVTQVQADFESGQPEKLRLPKVLPVRRKDGSVFMASIERVPLTLGRQPSLMAVFTDVNEQIKQQAQLAYADRHDVLTGLPNRRAFEEALTQAIKQLPDQSHLAVAYVDLDDLATINQTYGREIGNQVVIAIGQRMQLARHEHQFLAHVGGDEFAYLLFGLRQPSDYALEVQRLLGVIAEPLHLAQHTLTITASIGVTLYPQPQAVDGEQLLRQADQAMYAAKQAGKNHFVEFDTQVDEHTRTRLLQFGAIEQAIQHNEFVLFYQPKVHLPTGRVSGFEALIRWQHPTRGLVPPGDFIPLIASTPLAVEVGNWVIEAALAQLSQWNRQGLVTKVSVNIDAQQLLDTDFVPRLLRQLAAQPGVTPQQFQVEVLETGALGNMDHASELIHRLQTLGIECALDDFGTGYSSLTFLKQLAAHTIKIDQSFVRGMLDDVEHAAIVNSVLSLARNFDRRALAEGIETEAHGRALIEFGCEYGQGYVIARPMPAADVPGWLQQWQLPLSWANSTLAPPRDIPILLAKVEHRAWMRQLRAYLADPSLPAPVNDPAQCRFGKWLARRSTVRRFQRNPLFGSLQDIHEDLHRQTQPLLERKRTNPDADISADLAMLEALSHTMLEQLRTMRLSAADNGWASSDFGEL